MPASFEAWKRLVEWECKEIRGTGNIGIRVDIDPATFAEWCKLHGFQADAQGRPAFVNHAVLQYQKTGKGTVIT